MCSAENECGYGIGAGGCTFDVSLVEVLSFWLRFSISAGAGVGLGFDWLGLSFSLHAHVWHMGAWHMVAG